MHIDVRSEADLDRYEQLFDNPVLNLLFGIDNGSAYFLQYCDPPSILCTRATCFAVLLEVKDFADIQAARALPEDIPPPAEADRGNGSS